LNSLYKYILRIADDSLILGQRLSELCGHGPAIEEDIALTNIALDLIGQATSLYEYAAIVGNEGKSADDIAFLRFEREYSNVLLVEQPNGDFGMTIARQWLFDSFRVLFYDWKHSSEWLIRLGDGTAESHERVQNGINYLHKYADELFFMDEVDAELIEKGIALDLATIKVVYEQKLNEVLPLSTLSLPTNNWKQTGGRVGKHTEHLGHILSELQYMQRAYPNMEW
jgi:ring-1,2-phenylacetyl-CoA epoxidase subunit PaaC